MERYGGLYWLYFAENGDDRRFELDASETVGLSVGCDCRFVTQIRGAVHS